MDKIYFAIFARIIVNELNDKTMYWTLELASKLEDAPWPATKEELIDYAIRSGASIRSIKKICKKIEDER